MHNDLVVEAFGKGLLQQQMTFSQALAKLAEFDAFPLGAVGELAASNLAKVGLAAKNQSGYDTANGVEIKTAHLQKNTPSHKAWFSKDGKLAPIAGMVLNEFNNEVYYFWIEHEYYNQLNGNTIAIPFNEDGSPKRVTRQGENPWWTHQVTKKEFKKLVKEYRGG